MKYITHSVTLMIGALSLSNCFKMSRMSRPRQVKVLTSQGTILLKGQPILHQSWM